MDAEKVAARAGATPDSVRAALPPIRRRHNVTSIELVSDEGSKYHVKAKLNPEEEGDSKELVAKPSPPVTAPHDRHFLNRIRATGLKKVKNTIILPSVDVAADVALINHGKVSKTGGSYVVNDRTYGVEASGKLYPISGAGFVEMDRGAYLALQILIEAAGDEAKAKFRFDRQGIGEAERERALSVFRQRG